jgi:hypothetical protein
MKNELSITSPIQDKKVWLRKWKTFNKLKINIIKQ